MFETVTLTQESRPNHIWGMFAGMTGQAIVVICAVILSMASPAVLPHAVLVMTVPPPRPPAPQPGPGVRVQPRHGVRSPLFLEEHFNEPTHVPVKAPAFIVDGPEDVALSSMGGAESGTPNGVIGAIFVDGMNVG